MRGASAIEKLLEQMHGLPIRVLVVWEPMLPTDWSRPSGMVQSRISDTRVIQYWDTDHLVAAELQRQLSSEPKCCQRDGTLWDLVALYDKPGQWGDSRPVFAEGTVVDAAPAVEKRLAEFSGNAGVVALHPGLFLIVVFGACCVALCAEIRLGKYRGQT